MRKILITGANGLIGQTLVYKIRPLTGYTLIATSESECKIKGIDPASFCRMDITDQGRVAEVFEEFKPDVVVHCAALTQVDPCELDPDQCDRVNIDGTRIVAAASLKAGAHFIYMSTDFVFDGLQGPYSEDDHPNPVSTYGWSKLQGEFLTRSLKVPWTIVRTILVYGVTPAMNRSNLVTWVRDSLTAGKPIRVVNDQFRMPTLANDLADGVIAIADKGATGIFHLSGPEPVSVYDFALKIAKFFQLDESLITPITSDSLNQPGRRPLKTGFILDKAFDELGYLPKDLNEGLVVARNLIDEYSV